MLRKKIIKRCAQGHEMELSWKRCPRCTGRRPLQVEARDVVDQTMIAGPEAAPVDATRVVTPSVVRSRPPAPAVPEPPKFVPPPPPEPKAHPAWAGPPADPAAAHPAWAGPPASPTPPAAVPAPAAAPPPPPAAAPAPAPAPRVHPSWAGPSANPSPPLVEAPPAPAHPAWAGPPAPSPAPPAPPAPAPPVAAAPPPAVTPPPAAAPPPAPSAAPDSGVADRAFFERDAEISKAPPGRKAPRPAEPLPAEPSPAAPAAVPGLSRDLSVRSRAKIECVGGPLKGRMFMLSSGAYRFGKAPRDLPDSKAIVIAGDRFVSKDHAVILVEPNGIVLTDPGSTNGCFVNGNKVTHHTLENGDEIRLGETVFKFSKLGS